MASFEKSKRGFGLVVLGVARRSTPEAALEVARQSGVDFPILDGGTLPGVEEKVPQYTVYDHTGAIAHKQVRPAEGEAGLAPETLAAIDKALSRATPVLTIPVEEFQEPEIAKLARRAAKGTGLGRILTELDARIASGTEGEQAEGSRLRDLIIAHGERMLADAEAVRQDRPHRHFDMLKEVSKQYKGHDLGANADAEMAALRQDRAAMREVEASRLYEEMSLAPEKDRMRIYGQLKKKHAESRFTQQAAEEMGDTLAPAPAPPPPSSGAPDRRSGDNDDDDDEDKDD